MDDNYPQMLERVERLTQEVVDLRSSNQELAAQVAKLQSQLDRVIEVVDRNTVSFRDTIQILDAKSCVHEAVIRDLVGDLEVGLKMLPEGTAYAFKTKRLPNGHLDAGAYFDEWRQRLVSEEYKQADPYEGAVIFGGYQCPSR